MNQMLIKSTPRCEKNGTLLIARNFISLMLSLQNVKLWIILANGDSYIIKPGQIEHPMIALGEQNI